MWKELGAANPDPKLHGELAARYGEPHRKYHTLQHLEECFEKLDEVRTLAEHPAEIDLALWFHDAIYNVKRRPIPRGTDAEILVDVDLSILGAAPERFDEFERQVREEYAWVPDFLFRRERRTILKEFLARTRIFSSAHFRGRYEQQARSNIERSLGRLGA